MLDTVNTVKTDTHYWSGQIRACAQEESL